MITKRNFIVVGVVSYLLFVLLLTPAAVVMNLLPVPVQLKLGKVSGTLWQGEINALQYEGIRVERLRWSLNGWALFGGKLALTLNSGSIQNSAVPYLQSVVSYGFSGLSLHDTMLRMPVKPLLPLLALPMPVDASGTLVLDVPYYRQGQPRCSELQGNVSWQDARLQTPTGNWLALQSLFGQLSCDNGVVALTTDSNNPLGLDVKAVINAEQLRVNGTLKPDASMPQEVHQAMQFLGQADSQGRYPISF